MNKISKWYHSHEDICPALFMLCVIVLFLIGLKVLHYTGAF